MVKRWQPPKNKIQYLSVPRSGCGHRNYGNIRQRARARHFPLYQSGKNDDRHDVHCQSDDIYTLRCPRGV